MQKNIKSAFLLSLLCAPNYSAPGGKDENPVSNHEVYVISAWRSNKKKMRISLQKGPIGHQSKEGENFLVENIIKSLSKTIGLTETIMVNKRKIFDFHLFKRSSPTPEKAYEDYLRAPKKIDDDFLYLKGEGKIDIQKNNFLKKLRNKMERTGRKAYIKVTFKKFEKYLEELSFLFKYFLINKELKKTDKKKYREDIDNFSYWPSIFKSLIRKDIKNFKPKINIDSILISILDKNNGFDEYSVFYHFKYKENKAIFSEYFPEKILEELALIAKNIINQIIKEEYILLWRFKGDLNCSPCMIEESFNLFNCNEKLKEAFKKFFDEAVKKFGLEDHFEDENISKLNNFSVYLLLTDIDYVSIKTRDLVKDILLKIKSDKIEEKGKLQVHTIFFNIFCQVFIQINSRHLVIPAIDFFEKEGQKTDPRFCNVLTYLMEGRMSLALNYCFEIPCISNPDVLHIEPFINKFTRAKYYLSAINNHPVLSEEIKSPLELNFMKYIIDQEIQEKSIEFFNHFKKNIKEIFVADTSYQNTIQNSIQESIIYFVNEIYAVFSYKKKYEEEYESGDPKESEYSEKYIYNDLYELTRDYPYNYSERIQIYITNKEDFQRHLEMPTENIYLNRFNKIFNYIERFDKKYCFQEKIIKKAILTELVFIFKKMLESFNSIIFPDRPRVNNFDKAIPYIKNFPVIKNELINYDEPSTKNWVKLKKIIYKTKEQLTYSIKQINMKERTLSEIKIENILDHANDILRFTEDFIGYQDIELFLKKNDDHYEYKDPERNSFFKEIENIKIDALPQSNDHFFKTILKLIENMKKIILLKNQYSLIKKNIEKKIKKCEKKIKEEKIEEAIIDLRETEDWKAFNSEENNGVKKHFNEIENESKDSMDEAEWDEELYKLNKKEILFNRRYNIDFLYTMFYINGLEIINLIKFYMSDSHHKIKPYSAMKLEKVKSTVQYFINQIKKSINCKILESIKKSNDKLMTNFSRESTDDQLVKTIASLTMEYSKEDHSSEDITQTFIEENSFKRALKNIQNYLELPTYLKNEKKEKMLEEEIDQNSSQKIEEDRRQKEYFDKIDKLKLNEGIIENNAKSDFFNCITSLIRNLKYIQLRISQSEESYKQKFYTKMCEIALDILDLTVCYMTEKEEVQKPCDKVKKIYHETEKFLTYIMKNSCNEESQTFFRTKLDDINKRKKQIKSYFKAIMNNEMVMIYKKNGTIYVESRGSDDETEEDAAS